MLEEILKKYESLIVQLDSDCAQVCKNLPSIPCLPRCSDKVVCCKQIFPLSFVEAYYVSDSFKKLDRSVRRNLEKEAKKLAPIIEKKFAENRLTRLYKTLITKHTTRLSNQSRLYFIL